MKKVLLLGAGHAQLSVLQALARPRLPGGDVLLVTPYPRQIYSGMVPGLIAGRYAEDEIAIDVVALAKDCGVHLRLGHAVALDARLAPGDAGRKTASRSSTTCCRSTPARCRTANAFLRPRHALSCARSRTSWRCGSARAARRCIGRWRWC